MNYKNILAATAFLGLGACEAEPEPRKIDTHRICDNHIPGTQEEARMAVKLALDGDCDQAYGHLLFATELDGQSYYLCSGDPNSQKFFEGMKPEDYRAASAEVVHAWEVFQDECVNPDAE